ncbi:hypothetical protein EMIT0194MI4_10793 [Pseudomonas sp. IT-194MI4]
MGEIKADSAIKCDTLDSMHNCRSVPELEPYSARFNLDALHFCHPVQL